MKAINDYNGEVNMFDVEDDLLKLGYIVVGPCQKCDYNNLQKGGRMRIKKAINTAYEQHYGQIRKVDKAPYIIHPLEVFSIVSRFTDDEDTKIAALLHDTLEDTSYSASEMEREFGSNVVELVSLLSENKNLEWKDRKYLYIKRLKESKNKNAILISASDKLNNLASIQYAYRKFGSSVWDCFNAKKED